MKTLARLLPPSIVMATLAAQEPPIGYDDTPFLPDQEWRVHDGARPQPPRVDPGPAAAEPSMPPSDAVVLFDGEDLSAWRGRGGDAKWKIEDGAVTVNGTGDIETKQEFGDCQLHLEWRAPRNPTGEGQHRGNSGVFLFGRYEIQILDSHASRTYPDGQAAALYGQFPPDVNACRPSGEWQTFDIVFRAPRFTGDLELERPAYVTVFHNGVLVHDHRAMIGATAHRAVATYAPHAPQGPIRLQDHGDPVSFRNVWVRPLDAEISSTRRTR